MTGWDDACDVLVAGSGGGALTGALTAAREGLSVLVVEATDRFGGTTAYSGGGMWFPCNPVLRRAGDDDTVEDALTYFAAVVGDRTPRELQEAFVRGGAPLVEYLERDPALAFAVLPWPDYFGAAPGARAQGRHIVPAPLPAAALGERRAHLRPPLAVERAGAPLPAELTGGQALIGRLLLALDAAGADLRRSAALTGLVRDGDRVVGARVRTPDGVRAVRARRGVLLAAGGFERNAGLRARYGVPGSVRDTMGAPGNTGAALEAALAIGADVDLVDQAWWSPGVTHPDGSSTFSLWFTGGVLVDDAGERFTNESAPYDRIGREVLRAVDEGRVTLPYWLVFDDRDGGAPPVRVTSVPMAPVAEQTAAGLRHTAGTLEELAALIGVPPGALVATVERFNRAAAAGADPDLGRGDEPYDRSFAGGGSPLVPIERPPFSAVAFGVSDLGTKGGLRTDARARVLDRSGAVIPGLYAAGNTMAAVSGTTYPAGGNPIGACMVFGHLAALDMAGGPAH
ncbi:FAD-binding protein [Blastococcus sp. SYSU D00820]